MALWANMHASFILGLALIGPFALESALDPRGETPWRGLRDWALFGVAALAAALCTPQGPGTLIYPFSVMRMTSLSHIAEWDPADFSHVQPLEAAIAALLYVVAVYGVRLAPLRALVLLGLLHLALQHVRQETVLAIVGGLLLARPLARGAARPEAREGAPGLAGLLAASLVALRLAFPAAIIEGATKPAAALASVPEPWRSRNVLNDYGMGGYLIFNGVRPFIDGRNDMYGDAFTEAYAALQGADDATLAQTLARYDIAWTLLDPKSRLNGALARLGWNKSHEDEFATVMLRPSPR